MKAYQNLRAAAFAALNARRSKRLDIDMAAPLELRLLALLCGLMLIAAVIVHDHLNGDAVIGAKRPAAMMNVARVLPVVPPHLWRKLNVEAEAPPVLHALSNSGIDFQWRENIPVASIDGAELDHKIPPAIWLKLEQPGNAYVLLETDSGIFVKPLEEASPGFVSRCVTDRYFGNVDGEPAYLEDRDDVRVARLWIVQDAVVNPAQVPGYIALMPQDDVLSPMAIAKAK